MTQEQKQLLLQDLCARLPYGIKAVGFSESKTEGEIISLCEIVKDGTAEYANCFIDSEGAWWNIKSIKPYLRPMSSMTEEEDKEYTNIDNGSYTCPKDLAHIPASRRIDWLNAHHFDYRGLIPMGLALEVPEGMYSQ